MTTCPTCGSPVTVHTGDEGTSSYVPQRDETIERLTEALEDIADQPSFQSASVAVSTARSALSDADLGKGE